MAERRQCLRTYMVRGPVVYGMKNEIRYAILNCGSFGFAPPLSSGPGYLDSGRPLAPGNVALVRSSPAS